jgi:hypothetical protein
MDSYSWIVPRPHVNLVDRGKEDIKKRVRVVTRSSLSYGLGLGKGTGESYPKGFESFYQEEVKRSTGFVQNKDGRSGLRLAVKAVC